MITSTPNTIITDNNNENSSDPNPYAYPYFKTDDEIPLLYRSVNSFISLLTKLFESPSSSSSTGGGLHPRRHAHTRPDPKAYTQIRILETIARKIIARCDTCPEESGWVDSCGENSLFRLCQLARFHNNNNGGSRNYYTYRKTNANANANGNNNNSNEWEALRRRCDELILVVQKALMEAEPRAAFTVNNWNETPLHEFLKHCGFQIDQDEGKDYIYMNMDLSDNGMIHDNDGSGDNAGAKQMHGKSSSTIIKNDNMKIVDNNDNNLCNPVCGGDHDSSEDKMSSSSSLLPMPSLAFVQGLINNCPLSILTRNFQKGLPIHEACSISQASRYEYTNFPYASFDMESFLRMMMMSSTTTMAIGTPSSLTMQQQMHLKNHVHLQIIQRMIHLHPKSLLVLDHKQKTPLYRAVESMNCSVDVVIYILKAMESHFSGRDDPLAIHDIMTVGDGGKNIVKAQMRRAIFGLHQEEAQTAARARTRAGKQKIASPLRGLWNVFLHPRRVTEYMKHQLMMQYGDSDTAGENSSAHTLSLSQVILSRLREGVDSSGATRVKEARILTRQMGDIWMKTLVMMCAAYHGSMENISKAKDESLSGCLPVHAAIFSKAPKCIANLVIQSFPQDLRKKDEDGNTPLLLALSAQNSIADENGKESNYHVIKALTLTDRFIASIPDSGGRLALHIALEQNLKWSEGTKEIFTAYPGAVSVRNPITHTFPFLYAAATGELSMIYLFLRSDPSVICKNKRYDPQY